MPYRPSPQELTGNSQPQYSTMMNYNMMNNTNPLPQQQQQFGHGNNNNNINNNNNNTDEFQQACLFYSPRCPYSTRFLQTLQEFPTMSNRIIKYNIDSYKIPNYVREVPCIIVDNQVKPGRQAFEWLEQYAKMSFSPIGGDDFATKNEVGFTDLGSTMDFNGNNNTNANSIQSLQPASVNDAQQQQPSTQQMMSSQQDIQRQQAQQLQLMQQQGYVSPPPQQQQQYQQQQQKQNSPPLPKELQPQQVKDTCRMSQENALSLVEQLANNRKSEIQSTFKVNPF